jgi:hypothetical protein
MSSSDTPFYLRTNLLLLYKDATRASTTAPRPRPRKSRHPTSRPRPRKSRCPTAAAPKPRLPPHIPLETYASEHHRNLPGGGCIEHAEAAQHPDRGPESAWDRRASTRNPFPMPHRKGRDADSGGWKEAARPRRHQLRRVLLFSAVVCASVPSPSAVACASSASPHRFHQPSPHAATGSSSSRLRVGHARTAVSMPSSPPTTRDEVISQQIRARPVISQSRPQPSPAGSSMALRIHSCAPLNTGHQRRRPSHRIRGGGSMAPTGDNALAPFPTASPRASRPTRIRGCCRGQPRELASSSLSITSPAPPLLFPEPS